MKISKYIYMVSFSMLLLFSCKKDKPNRNYSVFDSLSPSRNEFDKWLKKNYIDAYNIDYKYRIEDIELDYSHNHAPADLQQSMKLAKIIKHVWLDAYVEVAGIDFMRKHAPRILQIIGSASWNSDGTMTLGEAEGGLKITLFLVNWLDPHDIRKMNEYFFKTMHHEFTHILQQDINYPQDYNLISAADYRPSGWHNRHSMKEYASLGFITSYAGSMAVEDITEVTCCYVTYSDAQWQRVMDAAGEEGRAKLNKKVEIMKNYMKNVWNIDMDILKKVVHRRMEEVVMMNDLIEPSWQYLITPVTSTATTSALRMIQTQVLRQLDKDAGKPEEHKENKPHVCKVTEANILDL